MAVNGAGSGRDRTDVVGVFGGPWDTGWAARDGAVLGFEDVFRAFTRAALAGEITLQVATMDLFRDYARIRDFLADCDTVYANCGPWAALLYLVREREQLDVRIVREVRTVGWVGYIWQEDVALRLERPGDRRVFPSHYARALWEAAAPGVSGTQVYYPIIGGATARAPRVVRTAGFFSVHSRDKGFDRLPCVIRSLRAGGHPVERLVLAGQRADPELYLRVAEELATLGVEVSDHGGMPHDEVRALMATCDCVLFLSVSSIESLGRVMVECSELGVPVITADFGAARDLVHGDYRIPVDYLAAATGVCDRPFSVAQLDLQDWQPPPVLCPTGCFQDTVDRYRLDAQPAASVLGAPTDNPLAAPPHMAFSYQCPVDGMALAHDLLAAPAWLQEAPLYQLVDLGGALKQYLLSKGYNPRVSFQPLHTANRPHVDVVQLR